LEWQSSSSGLRFDLEKRPAEARWQTPSQITDVGCSLFSQAIENFAEPVGKPSFDFEERQTSQMPAHPFVGKLLSEKRGKSGVLVRISRHIFQPCF
jgi:hypothetical protein